MFRMAFSFDSVAGGIGGSIVASMLTAMRWGVARGVFSNEAGLGSAPIAAAAARTDHASRQGYVNMTGTFFDTMIICMLTGLVIASSGMLGTVDPNTGKLVSGVQLTILAFSTVFGEYGKLIISVSIALFAFSTILGWEYYGEKALEYLVKARPAIYAYRIFFSLIPFVGATTTLEKLWTPPPAGGGQEGGGGRRERPAERGKRGRRGGRRPKFWNFSDTMNGLMIIPPLLPPLGLKKDFGGECLL